jgi:hypothetical protein
MYTGVVFVAFYTAQLAATLTVQQIKAGISGPHPEKHGPFCGNWPDRDHAAAEVSDAFIAGASTEGLLVTLAIAA